MASFIDPAAADNERFHQLEERICELEKALADYVVRYGMSADARRLLTRPSRPPSAAPEGSRAHE